MPLYFGPDEIQFNFEHGMVVFTRHLDVEGEWKIDITHNEGSPVRPSRTLPPMSDFTPTVPNAFDLYSAWIDAHPVPAI